MPSSSLVVTRMSCGKRKPRRCAVQSGARGPRDESRRSCSYRSTYDTEQKVRTVTFTV